MRETPPVWRFRRAQLLPISVPAAGGLTYGLNPNLGAMTQNGTSIVNNGIHELWAQGKMAMVTNVGTLIKPMTRAQYQANHDSAYRSSCFRIPIRFRSIRAGAPTSKLLRVGAAEFRIYEPRRIIRAVSCR